jgi:hypothetical protein
VTPVTGSSTAPATPAFNHKVPSSVGQLMRTNLMQRGEHGSCASFSLLSTCCCGHCSCQCHVCQLVRSCLPVLKTAPDVLDTAATHDILQFNGSFIWVLVAPPPGISVLTHLLLPLWRSLVGRLLLLPRWVRPAAPLHRQRCLCQPT